jgi:hypothetical protein
MVVKAGLTVVGGLIAAACYFHGDHLCNMVMAWYHGLL